MLVDDLIYVAILARYKFSYVVNQCSRYLAKTNKAHYEVLRKILSILLELHI